MGKRTWTKEELGYIEKWYGIYEPSKIAEHVNKTIRAVYAKATELGLAVSHKNKRTYPNSKIDKVEYEPKLNAPKNNWLAFFACIQSNITIDRALRLMGCRSEIERHQDKLAHIENMSLKEIYGEVE